MPKTICVLLLAVCLSGACPAAGAAGDAYEETFGPVRSAGAQDMGIMAPYIGTFRGSTKVFDDGETEYYFAVRYEWWSPEQTIVKFTVSMVIPSQERSLVRSEGYYGFDPFEGRLLVFGVFTGGMMGRGFVGSFDHNAGTHEVWARSMDAEGVVTWVRDGFELIDEDHWRNRTLMRRGDQTHWQQVHEDTYSRLDTT